MLNLPDLRVAPIEAIRPHEDFDPFRVDRLSERIGSDGVQINPMVCTPAPDGSYVLLDGATRREAFNRLGLPHAVVQVVDPGAVTLGTWHHVVAGGARTDLMTAVETSPHLRLGDDEGTPRITFGEGQWRTVRAVAASANAALKSLVGCYHGKMSVSRVTDPSPETVAATHSEWTAIVEFPSLTIEDVMAAAVAGDLVPAGITRFMVPERALRLNTSLAFLRGEHPTETKQRQLDEILAQRAREGRIRRYDEPVVILDE